SHVSSAVLVGEGQLSVRNVNLSDPHPHAGETVTVTAQIVNLSAEAIGPFTVAFYQGDPNFAAIAPPGLLPLATAQLDGLGPSSAGRTTGIGFTWTVPAGGGTFTLTMRADSDQVIPQVNRSLDDGFVTISVLPDPALVMPTDPASPP